MIIPKYRTELNEMRHNILVNEDMMYYGERDFLNEPSVIVDMMNTCFRLDRQAEEYVYIVGMSTCCCPLGIFEVSHGSCSGSISEPRGIFIRLLLVGATNFILIHNHPSGECSPSCEDKKLTKIIKECGELMNIPLLDHIIIGDGFYSMREHCSM